MSEGGSGFGLGEWHYIHMHGYVIGGSPPHSVSLAPSMATWSQSVQLVKWVWLCDQSDCPTIQLSMLVNLNTDLNM